MEKIDPYLQPLLRDGDPVDQIVLFKSETNLGLVDPLWEKEAKGRKVFQLLTEQAERSQSQVRKFLQGRSIAFLGLWIVNGLQLSADRELTLEIAKYPEVISIIPDPEIMIGDLHDDTQFDQRTVSSPTRGIRKIMADSVWALGFEGEGIVIGGQDTGYDWDHFALKNSYRGWDGKNADHNYNWHDAIHSFSELHKDSINPCGLDSKVPCDDGNHGTHTMGTMAGGEIMDIQVGVAPRAKWIGCRCMERGYGKPSTYIECFQWFLAPTNLEGKDPDPSLAPDVVNNSWSCPEFEGCVPSNYEVMREAVEALVTAGIAVVVSAGNSGSGGCSTIGAPPATYGESFVVGAIRSNDTIAGFSSRGPVLIDSSFRLKPDVVAPGVQVFSARPDSSFGNSSGTSMSAPHVAGAIALILSARPDLRGQVTTLQSLLTSTAQPMFTEEECGGISGFDYPNNTYGFGIINVLKAVEEALLLSDDTHPGQVRRLTIYPNPTTGFLSWKNDGMPIKRITMYDQLGKPVFSRKLNAGQNSINLPRVLPAGIYIIRIEVDGENQFERIYLDGN